MNDLAVSPQDSFTFEGFIIERVIIHRLYDKLASGTPEPKISEKLVNLSSEARDALQRRLTAALGSRSHGIEMSIKKVEADSFFQNAAGLMHSTDSGYISKSGKLAQGLHDAQISTSAPGGVLAVLSGRVGENALRFLAVIKAELQDGFVTDEQPDQVSVEYVAELLLTPAQRLYKIGILIETASSQSHPDYGYQPAGYRAFLFDHLITTTGSKPAAAYFYAGFLGMDVQASAKKLTQNFFQWSTDFINTAQLEIDTKMELHEALRVELRSKDTTISVSGFGDKHLDEKLRKEYDGFMELKGFPKNSVYKDTYFIKKRLHKRRKMNFTSNVQITTPPDAFRELVSVEGKDAESTLVRIKGQIAGQE